MVMRSKPEIQRKIAQLQTQMIALPARSLAGRPMKPEEFVRLKDEYQGQINLLRWVLGEIE